MIYRRDIDGLRAVAVLAVIVFHAGLGLPGGYVGVDVFFVISGYLITGLIMKDLDRGSFSLGEFWRRRIIRIWPASVAMIVVVLAASLAVMAPQDVVSTAEDAVAQMVMAANIHLWRTTDYFAPQSELRPLLHCWSLAVEEQFYLVLPILLVWLHRFGRRGLVATLVVGSIASFALSVLALDRHPVATFYLLPTRAWELALGSLLALRGVAAPRAGAGRELLALAALAAILVPCFLYNASTPFPGLAAVPVCVGTAILIGLPGTRLARLFETTPLRAVGLASYSLYLWHWPILALLRYVEGPHLGVATTMFALIGTAVFGTLSWRFIEQPFRRAGPRIRLRTAVIGAAIATAGGLSIGGTSILLDGVPGRFRGEARAYVLPKTYVRTWIGDRPRGMGAAASDAETPEFLLIGDSHAAAIGPAFDDAARRRGIPGSAAFRLGSLPIPSERHSRDPEWVERMVSWAVDRGVPRVVLCARWSRHLEIAFEEHCGTGDVSSCGDRIVADLGGNVAELADRLAEHGIELWMLLEVPQAPHPVHAGVRARLLGEPLPVRGPSRDAHLDQQRHVRRLVEAIGSAPVRIHDLASPFFVDGSDSSVYRDEEGVFYMDDNHLSIHGSRRFMTDHVDALLGVMTSGPVDDRAPRFENGIPGPP